MKIIDIHTHIYPDKVAQKTIEELKRVADVTEACDGTFSGTVESMERWGIDGFAALNILMNPARQNEATEFSASLKRPNILPFSSLHPDTPDKEGAVKHIRELGLYGIKMHPDYQGFFIDDERMLGIYELCESYDLPIILHMGYDPYSPEAVHGLPEALKRMARQFPRLQFIGAHMGGRLRLGEVEEHLVGLDNVWLDTSMSEGFVEEERAKRIIENHGGVIFGSDCPWHSPLVEIDFIKRLGLGDRREEAIFSGNAIKLLKL